MTQLRDWPDRVLRRLDLLALARELGVVTASNEKRGSLLAKIEVAQAAYALKRQTEADALLKAHGFLGYRAKHRDPRDL